MGADWTWTRREEMLAEVRGWALEEDCLPVSLAVAFHDDRVSALLELPPFALEDADAITDELCRFLPSIYPHRLALIRPAIHEDLDVRGVLYGMQVLLWERDGGAEHLVVPVPIKGGVDEAPFRVEEPDPWFGRVVAALDADPIWPPRIDTRFPPGYDLLVRQDSLLHRLMEELTLTEEGL